jgi:hypothetical protein
VAFQVDGVTQTSGIEGDQSEQTWNVLVQGLAIEDGENVPTSHVPHPEVVDPGERRRCDWPSLPDSTDSSVDPSPRTSTLAPSELYGALPAKPACDVTPTVDPHPQGGGGVTGNKKRRCEISGNRLRFD